MHLLLWQKTTVIRRYPLLRLKCAFLQRLKYKYCLKTTVFFLLGTKVKGYRPELWHFLSWDFFLWHIMIYLELKYCLSKE
ncbi:hypothetical protein M2133_002620 [Parabacteroides sp. PF5-6]|nr:hypothetical protein [Parabacteroides sp. PF5-6]